MPKILAKCYAKVATLLHTADTEDIMIRLASIFVNGGPITTGCLITTEDPSSPKAKQFLGKHMDTDCIVTLFAAISKDKSWVIYDHKNIVVAKLTNPAGINITMTNGIHSGKKSHNPHKLSHYSECLSERVLFCLKFECCKEGMNMNKTDEEWLEFVTRAITIIWPYFELD